MAVRDQEKVNAAARDLLMMSTRNASASQLVEKAYEYLQKPIALFDDLYRVVVLCAPGIGEDVFERHNSFSEQQFKEWKRRLLASDEPLIDEDPGGRYRRMYLDVLFNGVDIGKLLMMETRPFERADSEILKALGSALAIQLAGGSLHALSSRDRERSAILSALIHGEGVTPVLGSLTEYLGISGQQTNLMLVFRFAREEGADYRSAQARLQKASGEMLTTVDGNLVCLTWDNKPEKIVEAADRLAREEKLYCGVSRPFTDFALTRDYYAQALAALRVAMRRERPLLQYGDCMAEDVASLCLAERAWETFCRPEVLRLADYDREHRTNYMDTLERYLDNLCNMAETARSTFLHYNTIKYRLKQIEEISGISALTGSDLCELLFSIRLVNGIAER